MRIDLSGLRIGTRLSLGFGLVLLCAGVLLLIGLWRMSELQDSANSMVDTKVLSLTSAMRMREAGASLALSLRKVATPTDAAEGDRENRRITQILDTFAGAEMSLNKVTISAASKTALATATEQKQLVLPVIAKIRELVTAGNYFDGASLLKTDFGPLHEKWMLALAALADIEQADMKSSAASAQKHYR